ncbi:MAG TPA: hypothetical protein PK280_04570 [Planctomycetota bacterium]|nr:hypothetical protein [Planctomycetota bacterium]
MSAKRTLSILAAVAVLAAAATAAAGWLLLRKRPDGEVAAPVPGPPAAAQPTAVQPAPFDPAPAAPEWAALAPEGTFLLLGTSDLPALAADLRSGPAGKTAAAPGVRAFLDALAAEPAGELGAAHGAARLALDLAELSDGPAFLAAWNSPGGGARGAVAAFRVRPADSGRALHLVEDALKSPVAAVRQEPLGIGTHLRTAAAAGSEGRAWGGTGRWVVASASVAGCRLMLNRLAGAPPAAREDLGSAMAAAGAGRLAGCLNLRRPGGALPPALGWEASGWLGYSAVPGADGRWTERFFLAGRPAADGGLIGSLAGGGDRPVLASLPESTLGCFSAGVADGGRFWAALRRLVGPADPDGMLGAVAGALAGAAGLEFERDVAPAVRGEFTVACTRQRQALYPQTLVGVGLAPGTATRLSAGSDAALALFGNGGRVTGADCAGTRLAWLEGHSPVDPYCPAPCCAFRGDRLLAASSTVPLKELLSGRGGRWLEAADARRLGYGLLGIRCDLAALMPFAGAAAADAGLAGALPVSAARKLPASEELAEHLGALELVVGRAERGLWAELRAPLPLGAAAAARGALADF